MSDQLLIPVSLKRRICAYCVDFLIFIPLILLGLSTLRLDVLPALLINSFLALVFNFYFIGMHGNRGQTIGKKMFGIKVVNIDGSAIDYKTAFYRGSIILAISFVGLLIQFVSYIELINSGIDFDYHAVIARTNDKNMPVQIVNWGFVIISLFTCYYTKLKRAPHDFLAKTLVLDVRDSIQSEGWKRTHIDSNDSVVVPLKKNKIKEYEDPNMIKRPFSHNSALTIMFILFFSCLAYGAEQGQYYETIRYRLLYFIPVLFPGIGFWGLIKVKTWSRIYCSVSFFILGVLMSMVAYQETKLTTIIAFVVIGLGLIWNSLALMFREPSKKYFAFKSLRSNVTSV